jgi:MtN3 and saliva related transmembrane protein
MMLWEIIGTAATLCVSTAYAPQIVKAYRSKKMDDVSLPFLAIVTTGVFLWLLYGIHLNDSLFIAANSLICMQGLLLVLMKLHYSGKS